MKIIINEKYLTNINLFNKLLSNTLCKSDKLFTTEYFLNHKTINELMKITNKKLDIYINLLETIE